MKHVKKFIAVLLTVILLSSLSLPLVAFAENNVAGDHTTFEDFWDQMTDEDGNIDWRLLPKNLFKAYIWIKLFEAIMEFFRGIFNIQIPEVTVPETSTSAPEAEVTTVPATA